jgi:hypothetical protein
VNAYFGRKVSLQVSPRKGAKSAPKPPFRCEREDSLARFVMQSISSERTADATAPVFGDGVGGEELRIGGPAA